MPEYAFRARGDTQRMHKKIRVMVSGCLNVCIDNEQAVVYQPVSGVTEAFTIGSHLEENIQEMKEILAKKLE